jgi:hypothetical protein
MKEGTIMTKTSIAKKAVSVVIGVGVTHIVSGIISSTTEAEKATDRVAVYASSWVLGAMAVEATKKYTDAKIDRLVALWKEVNAKVTN